MEVYGPKVNIIIVNILRKNAQPMRTHVSHNVIVKIWESFGQDFNNVEEYIARIIDDNYLQIQFHLYQPTYHAAIHYSLGGQNRFFIIYEIIPREDRHLRARTFFDAELENPFEIFDVHHPEYRML
jgi:hypothetical protein